MGAVFSSGSLVKPPDDEYARVLKRGGGGREGLFRRFFFCPKELYSLEILITNTMKKGLFFRGKNKPSG